ncbi:MAG: oligosaccharide flippase family protein [Muribaculaceae bacterium]|nr:oligosaccharide flippase family protein [Muribaculaceae bacterium]
MKASEESISGNSGLNSYRNIIKGSSFFGGVQLFNILITLIRGKFVAIILGPEGMGISALFNSASNTIQRFASLGLNQSIIREVSDESSTAFQKEQVVRSSLRLANLTALLGFIICVAFSVPLSRLTFGDSSYFWQFMLLGAGVGLGISGSAKLAILQGLHEVKRISKSSIVGGLTGLCIGIPLYYLFGDKGIVPSIVAVFLALYIFYSLSLRKSFSFEKKGESWKKYLPIFKTLLSLGLVLMSGDVIATLVTYLINLFVRILGNVEDVGLYQAAHSVTYQFAGMIFSALAMDYFPRLSGVSSDNKKLSMVVNRQSEIVAWLITPAMSLLILSAPLLIRLLLSENFHSIIPLMRWMGIGMLLRAFSFPMAYITFAKGNKRVYFIMEGLVANCMTLVLSCLFYHWFGLIGLGYAIVADNAFCFVLYFIVNNRLYGYNFSREVTVNFLIGALMTGGCFVFSFFTSSALSYSLMGVSAAVALIWGIRALKSHFTENH